MGALKRIYENRFNLTSESLAIAAKSTFNRPISFWRERDSSQIKKALGYGSMKPIMDDRKRRKMASEIEELQEEAKRQKEHQEARARQAELLALIHNHIPENLESVSLSYILEY